MKLWKLLVLALFLLPLVTAKKVIIINGGTSSINGSPICTVANGLCPIGNGTFVYNHFFNQALNTSSYVVHQWMSATNGSAACDLAPDGVTCYDPTEWLNLNKLNSSINGERICTESNGLCGGTVGNPVDQCVNMTCDPTFNSASAQYFSSEYLDEENNQFMSASFGFDAGTLYENYENYGTDQQIYHLCTFADGIQCSVLSQESGWQRPFELNLKSGIFNYNESPVVVANQNTAGNINISDTIYYGALQANSPILETTSDPFVARCTIADDGTLVVGYTHFDGKTYAPIIERVDPKRKEWWHQECYSKKTRFDLLNQLTRDGVKKEIQTLTTTRTPVSGKAGQLTYEETTATTSTYRTYTIDDITWDPDKLTAGYDDTPEEKTATLTLTRDASGALSRATPSGLSTTIRQ